MKGFSGDALATSLILQRLGSLVATSSDVLRNVLLDGQRDEAKITIRAMTSDGSAFARAFLRADLEEPFSLAAPFDSLSGYLGSLGEAKASIALEEKGVRVSSGKSKCLLPSHGTDQFPLFPAPEGESVAVDLDTPQCEGLSEILKSAVITTDRSKNAVGKPSEGIQLSLLNKDKVRVESADGYRGVRYFQSVSCEPPDARHILVPTKYGDSVSAILKGAQRARIHVGERSLRVAALHESGTLDMVCPLLALKMPDLDRVFSAHSCLRITLDKSVLWKSLDRIRKAVDSARTAESKRLAHTVICEVKEAAIELSAAPEQGRASEAVEEIEATTEVAIVAGETPVTRFAFCAEFLADTIKLFEGKEIVLGLSDTPRRPILFWSNQEERTDRIGFLMPVAL